MVSSFKIVEDRVLVDMDPADLARVKAWVSEHPRHKVQLVLEEVGV